MVRGKKRELPRKNVNVDVNAAIHNRFDVEVVDAATGRVKKKARAYNVICYQLWSRMFTPATYFNYIHYGTGEGSPTQSDSKLFHFSGYLQPETADDVYNFDMENYTCSLTRKVQINPETAVGETITEVGIAYDKTEGTLCTHAMLQDMNGNPISIEKTGTDLINIYATVYLHLPGQIESTNFLIFSAPDGASQFIRWAFGLSFSKPGSCQLNAGKNPMALCSATNSSVPSSKVSCVYEVSSRTLKLTAERFGVNSNNIDGGAASAYFYYSDGSIYGSVFSLNVDESWFPGSDIVGEEIGTGDGETTEFSTKFALSEKATIKVDGVTVEAEVSSLPKFWNDMGRYFMPIWCDKNGGTFPIVSDFGGPIEDNPNYVSPCTAIFINPYNEFGIDSLRISGTCTVTASNDGVSWSDSIRGSVPEDYKKAKFWKVYRGNTRRYGSYDYTSNALNKKNIKLTTPPAEGAVITADYHTPVIAKDDQHVFDLTVTLSFNPYEAT